MEKLGGGGATRFRHQLSPSSSDRFLGLLHPQKSSSPSPPIELFEHDIFATPSGSSSASPTHPNPSPNHTNLNHNRNNHNGILAALNENLKSRSGSDTRPVFNHKASTSASLSSSSSTSPISSRIMIPKRPLQVERLRFHPGSAPVSIPAMAAAMRRRVRELEDAVSEEEDEDDRRNVILPPHEVVAARESPLLACSVLEGVGRTLKGRDLRQVRNAIWRRTGFID